MIDEALSLQRTTSLNVFGNSDGQPYTTNGWNTNLRRRMELAWKKPEGRIELSRFKLKDMRPAAVIDRVDEEGDTITIDTRHSSDRMVKQVYDRRRKKVAQVPE